MELMTLMRERHSVRQYLDRPIEEDKRAALRELAEECNREGTLHIQLIFDEPNCFRSALAHYGKFTGAANYIAIVGPRRASLQEDAGYYGEKLVLKAQELGLNTCWAALTHGKGKEIVLPGEKTAIIIALGYGATQGVPHHNRPLQSLYSAPEDAPDWFFTGMEAVALAPTAVNQQKFFFSYRDGIVTAKALSGFYSKIDLGIVKYHFEAITGHSVNT